MSEPTPIRAHDRAHIVAVTILQIIGTRPHDPVRAVAAYLRDEFSNIEHQLMSDLEVDDQGTARPLVADTSL
jgi:hypothetical protein